VHYCVPNMPGSVAQTSTWALTNVTLDYAVKIADLGFTDAMSQDAALRLGVNTFDGAITCEPVAVAHGLPYRAISAMLPA
jgi:alanine dehydrogenase